MLERQSKNNWRRTPNTYSEEDKKTAIAQLNDETRIVLDMRIACVLLDISLNQGHAMARLKQMPGARRIGHNWKVTREILKDFLYAKE